MRFASDTGGTFTDLLVEDDDGLVSLYKASTTPTDPIAGVMDALGLAAAARGLPLADMLAGADTFIHGTTHAINAIITGRAARTALVVTEGHRDILVFREGGRVEPFNQTIAYPKPYVPRSLTFEAPGRIVSTGEILRPLDEVAVLAVAGPHRGAGRRGGGRGAAVVDHQPGARAAGGGDDRGRACRACPTPCRTPSIRPCASSAAPPPPRSTHR